MTKLTHKNNGDSRILSETPTERGDRGRGVQYIDRFPAVCRDLAQNEIVQDKMRDIIDRDKLPTLRSAFELNALLAEVASTTQKQVIETGDATQIAQLRRQLITLQVSVKGAQ
jgi:hypothetical protein